MAGAVTRDAVPASIADRVIGLHRYDSVTSRRRAESVALIASGLAATAIPTTLLVALLLPNPMVNVPLVATGFVCYALIIALLRRRHVSVAAWVLVGYFALIPLAGSLILGQVQASPPFLMISVVAAACLLPPRQVMLAAAVVFGELALMSGIDPGSAVPVPKLLTYVAVAMVVLTATAVVLALAIERALRSADDSRREAQRAAADLMNANTELEDRVKRRTTELNEALRREQRLSAKLGELSVRDPLTGLHNRRYFDEEMPRLFAAAQRRQEVVSVAAVDLDNFKSINDRHTHAVGDEVLRVTARIMAEQSRTADVLVRMGGEEFVLLMPGASEAESTAACERMRREIEAFAWDSLGPGLVVTASFGVATSGGPGTANALLQAADQLLYRAKREGKNRVSSGAG